MKTNPLSFLALAALATPSGAALARAPANTPRAEMHSVRLEVKFVEAPTDKVNAWSLSYPVEKNAAEELLAARAKDGAKMTEIALQTTMIQDVPLSASQADVIPFVTTNNGKPQTNFLPVTNSINVTPHFNPDGTIRLNLSLQRSEVQKSDTPQDGPPPILTQSTSTLRTLNSGGTLVLGGFVTGGKPGKEHGALVGETELLIFVTATVLPDAQKP